MSLIVFAPAHTQQKLLIGCTATTDCSSAMIGVNEGIFKRLDVDAERGLIAISSNAPAALLSNSIQIGGPTAPLFLQAVDGGLDLVAVSGASVMYESTARTTDAAFARTGVTIDLSKDFVGKKVAAPGLAHFCM